MKKFGSQHGVKRASEFLDRVARAAWEPFHENKSGFPREEPTLIDTFDSKGRRIDKLSQAFATTMGTFCSLLQRASTKLGKPPAVHNAPHGFDIAAPDSAWTQFEYDQLFKILTSNDVVSIADAVVKATAYLQTVSGSATGAHGRYLFRGQSNIDYELVPRLGRLLRENIRNGKAHPPSDLSRVTDIERNALTSFQSAWPVSTADELDKHITSGLAADDPSWWVLMQHYADAHGDGTRMLDVTSSLQFGLLFACVNWTTGTIDTNTDGVLYLFVEGQNANVDDFLLRNPPRACDFFDSNAKYPMLIRMVLNPPHNERSKAQGGGFIWWPAFWEPLANGLPYLRIPGKNKPDIARELLAVGVGPKEAVRGKRGLENERNLRAGLGLPAWRPIGI